MVLRTLLIVRHAKTERTSATGTDIDRKLTERGLKDAPALGKALRKLEITVDQVFCSTAVRARETAELLLEKLQYRGTVDYRQGIYLAEPNALVDLLRTEGEGTTVMIIGHNPGLEALAGLLSSGRAQGVQLCTGAMVRIDFDMPDWTDIAPGRGALTWILTPETVHAL
jgi:phosphohistidine phosphatase